MAAHSSLLAAAAASSFANCSGADSDSDSSCSALTASRLMDLDDIFFSNVGVEDDEETEDEGEVDDDIR